MTKLLSAIGILAGVLLAASCTKMQNYGSTAVVKLSNGWWVLAYSSKNGLITIPPPASYDTASNHIFFSTYNASSNSPDSLWADDLDGISEDNIYGPGGAGTWGYDVKAELGVDPATNTLSSGATGNLYPKDSLIASLVPPFTADSAVQINNPIVWAKGQIFPKGGLSRTGVKTDSIFVQFLFANAPGDTLTIKGVARTGFDGDDWPISPYTPTP